MIKIELGFYGLANYIQFVKGYTPSEAYCIVEYIESCGLDCINIDEWLDSTDFRIVAPDQDLQEAIDSEEGAEHSVPYKAKNGYTIFEFYD